MGAWEAETQDRSHLDDEWMEKEVTLLMAYQSQGRSPSHDPKKSFHYPFSGVILPNGEFL